MLDRDPRNVEALTYSGWLLVRNGAQLTRPDVVDLGVGLIRKAIAADTTYADAHCLLGVSLARFVAPPDPAAALPELDTCLANDPPALVRQLVEPVRVPERRRRRISRYPAPVRRTTTPAAMECGGKVRTKTRQPMAPSMATARG